MRRDCCASRQKHVRKGIIVLNKNCYIRNSEKDGKYLWKNPGG